MSSTQQRKRSTKGWDWMKADPDHRGASTGNLVADTDEGEIVINANAKFTGRNAGMRHIHTRNPDGTWTSLLIDARGALVGLAHADGRREAADLVKTP